MGTMDAFVETVTEEAQLSMSCACGGCHPTATFYRDDPLYERHEDRLAEGPCCCGRFFVVGHDAAAAQARADGLAERRRGDGMAPHGYLLRHQQVKLPWGTVVAVVSADLPQDA